MISEGEPENPPPFAEPHAIKESMHLVGPARAAARGAGTGRKRAYLSRSGRTGVRAKAAIQLPREIAFTAHLRRSLVARRVPPSKQSGRRTATS